MKYHGKRASAASLAAREWTPLHPEASAAAEAMPDKPARPVMGFSRFGFDLVFVV
jgi:hypothetical protein